MSFGKSIARIKAGVRDPTKRSVVQEIDQACLNIQSFFEVAPLQKKIVELLKIAKRPGKFNRDKFFATFFELYELVYAPDFRATGCFHASSLEEDCERRLYYEILLVKPTDEKFRKISPNLQRIFDVGTWWHTYIQYQLYKAGILERAEVPVVDDVKKINSRADGIVNIDGRRLLLEIKSMNSRVFAKCVNAPIPKHVYQASIYGVELDVPEILFIYVNKDTSELREFIVPVDKKSTEQPYRKMRRVLKAVEDRELPDRICKNKFSEIALGCEYCTKCFSDPA